MIVFWRLVLALILTDFTLQPEWFYKWKFGRIYGRVLHVALFFALAVFLCRGYLDLAWINMHGLVVNGFVAIGIISALHFGVDELFKNTRYIVLKRGLNGSSFVLLYLLEAAILFFFTPDINIKESGYIFWETWTVVVTGFLLLFTFCETLIIAFDKDICLLGHKTLCGLPTPDIIFMGRMQRAVFYLIMLIPGHLFVLFILLWAWASLYAAKQRILDISKFNLYFGSVFALLLGLWVRLLIYG